jgi:alcohol dehydrogenase
MDFTYHMPTKVRFGRGVVGEIRQCVDEVGGGRILIVTGRGSMKKTGALDKVTAKLDGLDVEVFDEVENDPSAETVDKGAEAAQDADVIVALGGGSPIDAAKAISVVAGNGGGAAEYVGGRKITKPCPAIIAIPTTAGTGSEVTEVSVLSDRRRRVKKSFRSVHMYPKAALDDPDLTRTMPKNVTAACGLDALTHAVEALSSKKSQPMTDPLCMEAARLVLDNLERAYDDGDDMEAREAMMLASLMAGIGITHAAAGLAHGLSYSLWRACDTSHGLACGSVLPHVMRYNLGFEGGKYAALAWYCGLKSPEDLICRVERLNKSLGVPSGLRQLGVGEKDFIGMIELGLGGSTRINPRPVDGEALLKFIKSIM